MSKRRAVKQPSWKDAAVLTSLIQAGPKGILGLSLSDDTWRFGSNIHRLRTVYGFKIKSKHIGGKHWRYTLEGYLPRQGRLFQ